MQAVLEVSEAAVRQLRTLRYEGTPTPAFHHPLLLLHALARAAPASDGAAAGLLVDAQALPALRRFAAACRARAAQYADPPAARKVVFLEPGYLTPADALGYLNVALMAIAAAAGGGAAARRELQWEGRDGLRAELDAVLDTMAAVERAAAGRIAGGRFTTPATRFALTHGSLSLAGARDLKADSFRAGRSAAAAAASRPSNASDPHYLTDRTTPADVACSALAALTAVVAQPLPPPAAGGAPPALLPQPLLTRLRTFMAEPSTERAQQAAALLATVVVVEPAVVDRLARQNLPKAVNGVLRQAVVAMARSEASGSPGGGAPREPPAPDRAAAVCVQFFLRLAAAPVATSEGSVAPLVAGESRPGPHAAKVARLPHLAPSLVDLMVRGSPTTQQLAAELLRLLVTQRPARAAVRDKGGMRVLLEVLNASSGQTQFSTLGALKTLWAAQDGAALACCNFGAV